VACCLIKHGDNFTSLLILQNWGSLPSELPLDNTGVQNKIYLCTQNWAGLPSELPLDNTGEQNKIYLCTFTIKLGRSALKFTFR
jgi:hypothetical protein